MGQQKVEAKQEERYYAVAVATFKMESIVRDTQTFHKENVTKKLMKNLTEVTVDLWGKYKLAHVEEKRSLKSKRECPRSQSQLSSLVDFP
jgi:hypothetical protein